MKSIRALSGAVLALWLASSGCTTLREIPRSEFSNLNERKGVRVETRDGLVYDFDYAEIAGDSLTGYRHRSDIEGPVDQTVSFAIPLDDIEHLNARRFDWYRTGIVGGTVLAGVLVAGLGGAIGKPNNDEPTSGGGGGRIN